MVSPYREPGQPRGRLIHDAVRVFFTKQEWSDLQTAAQADNRSVEEWIYDAAVTALRERQEERWRR